MFKVNNILTCCTVLSKLVSFKLGARSTVCTSVYMYVKEKNDT